MYKVTKAHSFKTHLCIHIASLVLMQITACYTFHGKQKLYAILAAFALFSAYMISNLLWVRKSKTGCTNNKLRSISHVRFVLDAYMLLGILILCPFIALGTAILSKSFAILMLTPGLAGLALLQISHFVLRNR